MTPRPLDPLPDDRLADLTVWLAQEPRFNGARVHVDPDELDSLLAEVRAARAGRDATPDAEEVRLLRGLVAAMSRQISEVLTLPDLPLSVPLRSALCSMQEHAESARIRAGRDARATPGTARVRGGEGDAE